MSLRAELKKQGDYLFRNRSYLPLVILIPGIYIYVKHEAGLPDIMEKNNLIYELACFGVCLLGFIIRVVTIGFSADSTSGRNTRTGQIAESLNTTGVYSFCRHPLYLGNFLIWLGIAAFTQNFWFIIAFIFVFWVYYERIMYAEEEYLIGKFGNEYLNYSDNTPAFIPGFKNYKKPILPFSFRKIIRQEKAGILNLFAVILLLRVAGEYFEKEPMHVELFWILGFCISLLWYLVIKILQKTTVIFSHDRPQSVTL
jgi:protein-S-isoprenylcysteine O-methyltransferase Ste14